MLNVLPLNLAGLRSNALRTVINLFATLVFFCYIFFAIKRQHCLINKYNDDNDNDNNDENLLLIFQR